MDLIAAQAACVNLNELSGEDENKENCPTETAHLQASIQQLSKEITELRYTLADKDEQIHTALSQKQELEKLLECKVSNKHSIFTFLCYQLDLYINLSFYRISFSSIKIIWKVNGFQKLF